MKKWMFLLAVVCSLITFSSAGAVVPISGAVTTSMGLPIPGATITITPAAGGTPITVTTGADGLFQVSKIPGGKCTMTVTAKEYKSAQSPAQFTAGAHTHVKLIENGAKGESSIEGNPFVALPDFPLSGAGVQGGADGGGEE